MKKNVTTISMLLRNNDYLNTLKNFTKKDDNLEQIKYDLSTTSNIINEYKKLSKANLINSEFKLNKANSLYNRNNTISKDKQSINTGFFSCKNKKLMKKKLNSNIFNNINKKRNISINNMNNFYNDDSSHSSMETIKKILYSTDNKTELKKDNINNILKNSKFNSNIPNLDIFNNLNKTTKSKEKEKEKEKEINKDSYNKKTKINLKNSNIIDKDLINRINNELTLNARKVELKSMKILKTNNNKYNYDCDNDDSINISDEFKDIIKEKNNNNNKNYTFRKIHNNINININNNTNNNGKKSKNKINNIKSDIKEINKNKFKNIYLKDNINFYTTNIQDDKNKNDDIFYLKEKIKELNDEIKNKNILINEYSNLAIKSKIKFEQLMTNNKNKIEQIRKDNKKQNMLYKSKIISLEKEKQNFLNKYLENKKYTDFLEQVLFNQNNLENGNNVEENKKVEIIKKLMNDIMKLKIELENKKKDNEKLKNIILKYKESTSYRAISNPKKNINNINAFERIKNNGLATIYDSHENKKEFTTNLNKIMKIILNK